MLLRVKVLAAGLCLAFLAACTQEIRDVGRLSPSGSGFARALYDGYLDLSKDEYAEKDLRDSNTFANRARDAAAGGEFGPEAIADRQLPGDAVEELSAARARLVAALDASGRSKAPAEAARAQVMFDCWMEEAEEEIGPDHVEPCRSNFYDAIAKVEAALAVPEAVVEPAVPGPYIVLFDFDSAEITEDSITILNTAANNAAASDIARVRVIGHTDRAGSNAYNDALAARRAQAVSDYLTGQGVPADRIDMADQGETQPIVPTDDGVEAQLNRRVEITLER